MADPGVVQCTYGGEDEYATMEVYDTRRASLKGRVGDTDFQCPLDIDHIRVCGPGCKILPYVTLYGAVDRSRCHVSPGGWDVAALNDFPTIQITQGQAGHVLYWHKERPADACTFFRIDPSFARAHEAEYAVGETVPDDLGAYVGRYPHDAIGGVRFLDHPLFRDALAAMPRDEALVSAVLEQPSTSLPIHRRDGLLHVTGCSRQDCSAMCWVLRLAPDGSALEGCLSGPGDGSEPLQDDCRLE